MDVDEQVDQRQQLVLDVVRDQLGRRALGLAGEHTVQVGAIDRRGARGVQQGRHVQAGDDDEPALDAHARHALHQLHQCHRALVLVAVVAAGQQHGRALAALQHGDGIGMWP